MATNGSTRACEENMEFSKADRNLLARVKRILDGEAGALEKRYGANWSANGEAFRAKRTYDRLCREARDLAALSARLRPNDGGPASEALRRVLTLAGQHISPEVAEPVRKVLARWDDHQRRLAAFRAGAVAQRRRPRAERG
jgi:hypothetical protein